MHRFLEKISDFLILNILSLIRFLIILYFVNLFSMGEYQKAVAVILSSGIIALLRYLISENHKIGLRSSKVLNYVAGKLTLIAMMIRLKSQYSGMEQVLSIFAVKLLSMVVLSGIIFYDLRIVVRDGWYEKVNTLILYSILAALIYFSDLPSAVSNILIIVCNFSMLITLILYFIRVLRMLGDKSIRK